ncbi:zinc-dependent alcohol dehydrogenase [Phycicoccus avicenniae]|uniref:zinc-dependent alcohol dehydrogenase n=1 Tax=Phycicoccus avicenniae TaxID=2828860 RepID=UPI003D287B4C
MVLEARAFWLTGPGRGELRMERLPDPGPDDVLVRTLVTGVSRGTEALVARGAVPASEHTRMRAPFQAGDFPWPVKYGYLAVGVAECGPAALRGRRVFVLHPHQDRFVVPASAVTVVPDDVPTRRAVLAGIVETAVTVLWDAGVMAGDRVAVVGAGPVGCCVAVLLARTPGTRVTLVDVDPARASVATALGVGFALAAGAPREHDVVVHASGTAEGLRLALDLAAADATVVEASWHGDREVCLPLGGAFHARRLDLRSSQVGTIPPGARRRWDPAGRRALALDLLRDSVFDHLLAGESVAEELPDVVRRLAAGTLPGLMHTVRHAREDPSCSA